MASGAYNKAVTARAAAILTTGEVAGATFDLNEAYASQVSVQLAFTLGSLTNVIARFYVSSDGTTFIPISAPTGAVATETVDANATRAYTFANLGGWKYFRASLQGTGTVTSSTATLTYRYLRRGSQ